MPSRPSLQIDTKPANASSSASTASASAAPNVTSAGRISSRPECTMMIDSSAAASANSAMPPRPERQPGGTLVDDDAPRHAGPIKPTRPQWQYIAANGPVTWRDFHAQVGCGRSARLLESRMPLELRSSRRRRNVRQRCTAISAAGYAASLAAGGRCAGWRMSPAAAQQDFYAGKQITFIVGAGVGGGYDLQARTTARHLGRHIPGNPTIVVQNMPAAGSMAATNFMFSARAQGRHHHGADPARHAAVQADLSGRHALRDREVRLGRQPQQRDRGHAGVERDVAASHRQGSVRARS